MDALDLAILRQLTWRPFDPADAGRSLLGPQDVARELGVHASTVTRRLARMRDDGVLGKVHAIPALELMGLQSAEYAITFPDAATKARGLAQLDASPEVMDAFGFVGTEAWVAFGSGPTEDLDAIARRVATAAGAVDVALVQRREWSADTRSVRAADRRILAVLYEDALAPLTDVARRVGLTPKTVRARHRVLARAGAFMVLPACAPERVRGAIPVVLAADLEADAPPGTAAAFVNAFPQAFLRGLPNARTPYVHVAVEDARELDALVRRAEAVPGVRRARHLLVESSMPCRGPREGPVLAPAPAPA